MRVSTRTLAIVAATSAALFVAFVVFLLMTYFPPAMETIDIPVVPRA